MEKQKNKKKKRSFRNEVIALTLSACIISVFILGVVQTALSVYHFSEQAHTDLEFYLENTNGQFDTRVKNMENMIISFRNNTILKQFMEGDNYNIEEVREQFISAADLFSEANVVNSDHPFVDCVYLFNSKGKWVNSQFYPMVVEKLEIQNQFLKEISEEFMKSDKEYRYISIEERTYVCTRIYDENMNETGCCILSIEKEAVEELFDASELYEDRLWMVAGAGGEVLFANEGGRKISGELVLNHQFSNQEMEVKNETYMIHAKKTGFGMKSNLLVSKRSINRSILSTIRPFALIFIVVIAITGILVFLASMKMTKPLKWIGEDIQKFGNGKLNGRMREFDTREFEEISHLFNEMTEQIKELITEVYEKQLLATQAQVRYLQSQINPHFMFNILSMLSMRAALSGDKQMQKLLGAFSKLIQGKIFRKGEIQIPFSEEIELIEFYLLLQSERFSGKIVYEICCDEDVKTARIPRLMIEPLVENAVAHGLEPKQEKGYITVVAKEQNGKLWVQVKDNGVGFDVKELEKKEQKADKKHTHIGLVNTQQMLRTVYGEEATMEIQSEIDAGTCVTICLPLEKEVPLCGE